MAKAKSRSLYYKTGAVAIWAANCLVFTLAYDKLNPEPSAGDYEQALAFIPPEQGSPALETAGSSASLALGPDPDPLAAMKSAASTAVLPLPAFAPPQTAPAPTRAKAEPIAAASIRHPSRKIFPAQADYRATRLAAAFVNPLQALEPVDNARLAPLDNAGFAPEPAADGGEAGYSRTQLELPPVAFGNDVARIEPEPPAPAAPAAALEQEPSEKAQPAAILESEDPAIAMATP